MSTPVAKELATRPALPSIRLNRTPKISNRSGVTVLQVVEALCHIFHRRLPNTSVPQLPDKIWLQAFSLLDYTDLQISARVCKRFQALTEKPMLEEELWGAQVLSEDQMMFVGKLHVHPFLLSGRIKYEAGQNIDQVMLHLWAGDKCRELFNLTAAYGDIYALPLNDVAVAKQPATDPPVSVIGFRYTTTKYQSLPNFYAHNAAGVTVLQVMETLCNYFARPPPNGMRPSDVDQSDGSDNEEDFTIADLMGGIRHWTGIATKELDQQGQLLFVLDAYVSWSYWEV